MVVGRRSFPIGKVTFQGRTVKLREGTFLAETVEVNKGEKVHAAAVTHVNQCELVSMLMDVAGFQKRTWMRSKHINTSPGQKIKQMYLLNTFNHLVAACFFPSSPRPEPSSLVQDVCIQSYLR